MSLRVALSVLAIALVCCCTAVVAQADGTPEAPTFHDIRSALPAASFQVPALAQCCGQCGSKCGQKCGQKCGSSCGCKQVDPCCKQLEVSVNLVAWVTAMSGNATVAGRDMDVDLSVGDVFDILDKVESMFQGNVRVDYGRWFARFGGSYIKLGDDFDLLVNPGPGAGINVPGRASITQAYYSFVLGGNIKRCAGPRVGRCCSEFRLDAYGGVRWVDMDVNITLPRPQVARSRDWVDPIIGAHIVWDLKNNWLFDVDADIGGFGLQSDLTWRLRMGAQYNFTRWFGLTAGWLFLDYDYETGSGTSRFRWDVLTHGPYFGLNFRF